MTMYFPLVVHGAMLVEPTETERKATLDQFIGAFRSRRRPGEERRSVARRPRRIFAPRRRPRRDARGAQAGAGVEGAEPGAGGRVAAGFA